MTRTTDSLRPDISIDPFQERSRGLLRRRIRILGARFEFESRSRELLDLVDSAYAGLPAHRLPGTAPLLRIRLELIRDVHPGIRNAPAPMVTLSGAGFLCGAGTASSFVAVSAARRCALVVVPHSMLGFAYHTRYELIEFAVFTLASRVQGLVPLHAASVGVAGRGLLLMGGSGAGKSTLALQCLLQNLDFVSEDSTFVAPDSMRVTGVANFLHVRANSLKFVERPVDAAMIRNSPVIRRRSGIAKFEVDLRQMRHPLAVGPLKLAALIFLSKERAGRRPLLAPLTRARTLSYLHASQPYAASLPEWRVFKAHALKLDAFELRRGRHPSEAVAALQALSAVRRR